MVKKVILEILISIMIAALIFQTGIMFINRQYQSEDWSYNAAEKVIHRKEKISLSQIIDSLYAIDPNITVNSITRQDSSEAISMELSLNGGFEYFNKTIEQIKVVKYFNNVNYIEDNVNGTKNIIVTFSVGN